jgi:hypothetical protein
MSHSIIISMRKLSKTLNRINLRSAAVPCSLRSDWSFSEHMVSCYLGGTLGMITEIADLSIISQIDNSEASAICRSYCMHLSAGVAYS